jgi:glutamate N-acetyltransferase/amino-acid N-acetyltransferase
MMKLSETDKGVCVQGFKAGGWRKDRYGVAVILSEVLSNCAVAVTSNRVKAAPIMISLENVKDGKAQGVVANSGNANAYTGEEGLKDARRMCKIAAQAFSLKEQDFLVASTGVIGRRIDLQIIEEGIRSLSKKLGSSGAASLDAARALMTTDTQPKMISVKTTLSDGSEVEIGGIAKGAGMIAPKLHATMLCFITTNAYIPEGKMKPILNEAVEQSFNQTVVDGDMSTNDFVAFFANGLAGNEDVDENFQEALNYVARELAKMIAMDGEGSTKFVQVEVKNAATIDDARKAARAIVGSNLVKAAIFGGDPNWGRIVAALGSSGATFDPGRITLSLNGISLVDNGKILAFQGTPALEQAKQTLQNREIEIIVDLHEGRESAVAYGCDLTPEYVKINAEYTT